MAIGFRYHPAMKAVASVRKSLGIRTAFNILGPLLNPASTKYSLIGVYSPALSPLLGATLQRLGIQKALIVHSHGLDELTPMGDAHVVEVTPDTIKSYRWSLSCVLSLLPTSGCSSPEAFQKHQPRRVGLNEPGILQFCCMQNITWRSITILHYYCAVLLRTVRQDIDRRSSSKPCTSVCLDMHSASEPRFVVSFLTSSWLE